MSKLSLSFLEGKVFSRSIQRWARAARQAPETELSVLRRQRNVAKVLKTHLNKLIHVADERLALPRIGSTKFAKPMNSDWAWRPELWRGPLDTPGMSAVRTRSVLGNEVTLFHDCDLAQLTLRQLRNRRAEDLAPFALRMDVFQFEGSFLSIVIDLPQDCTNGLKRNHLLRMDTIVELEKPLEVFARLNIKHGPNTEQMVQELSLNEENHVVEFDLAYSNLNEKRVERAWVDLIFDKPQMNQVVLRDVTFSRRPRANI